MKVNYISLLFHQYRVFFFISVMAEHSCAFRECNFHRNMKRNGIEDWIGISVYWGTCGTAVRLKLSIYLLSNLFKEAQSSREVLSDVSVFNWFPFLYVNICSNNRTQKEIWNRFPASNCSVGGEIWSFLSHCTFAYEINWFEVTVFWGLLIEFAIVVSRKVEEVNKSKFTKEIFSFYRNFWLMDSINRFENLNHIS